MTERQIEGLSRATTQDGIDHWTVRAIHEVAYDVITAHALLDTTNPMLATAGAVPAAAKCSRRLVVIDEKVNELYGEQIRDYFAHYEVRATYHVLEAHEMVKNWDSVHSVTRAMVEAGIDRRSEPVVAIGGGVLLDIVGFAASIYRRSAPYIRIPTTLIGLVDAGVGVKTGVNFGEGKNKIGSYAAPVVTYIDRSFLQTLDRRHLSNGMAEILKMALIKSRNLMSLLETYGQATLDDGFAGGSPTLANVADDIIGTSIHLMLEELQPNLWEANLERCVDYGHTFSPTVEMKALPELLHGEAVCVDMALSSVLSFHRGNMTQEELYHVLSIMYSLDLPIWNSALEEPSVLNVALADTIRHRGGKQRIPLPIGIGDYKFANDVSEDEITHALNTLRTINNTWRGGKTAALETVRELGQKYEVG